MIHIKRASEHVDEERERDDGADGHVAAQREVGAADESKSSRERLAEHR